MPLLALLFFLAIFVLIEWQNRREEKKHSKTKQSKVVEMETEYDYNSSA